MIMNELLLRLRNAVVEFPIPHGMLRALDDVSLSVTSGETVAVVGESGCGKTTLARAILGLQPLVSGSIEVQGKPVISASRRQASRLGMVWQDPYASLDPRWTVGRSIAEPLTLAGQRGEPARQLAEVGLDPLLVSRYPHQLSGGQRQRVAIGRALALRPKLVICDEPTAALDLSIQAQILNLLKDLQGNLGLSYLYISHDLVTVRFLADRVLVMYAGKIVEDGETEQVFTAPKHSYTQALLDSAPSLEKLGIA